MQSNRTAIRRFFSAALLLVLAASANAALAEDVPLMQNPQLTHALVESSKQKEYMSICPSLCELADGSLLIAYHRSGHVDFVGDYSTWVRDSRDGGLTWSQPRLVADKMQSPGVVQLKSGAVLLNGLEALSDRSTTMHLMRSTDEGKTWAKRKPIWEKFPGMLMQGGCGSLVVLNSGRILCPYFGTDVNYGDGNQAGCFYSDDDGQSWRQGSGKVGLPKRGAMEPSVAELKDGTLVMALRTQFGFVYVSRSEDHGDTWSEAWSSGLESPENTVAMTTFPDGNTLLLFYCSGKFDPAHHHGGERTPLTAAVSSDAGKSWRKVGDIVGGPHELGSSGSNSICFTSKGKVVMAYDFSRIPWDRDIKTGGVWVAIADLPWFEQK